jgi:hypothetical protein
MRTSLEFYECEHNGDLDNYIEDIESCGGCVINSSINLEAEIGYVMIEHSPDFWDKFKETDAFNFLN